MTPFQKAIVWICVGATIYLLGIATGLFLTRIGTGHDGAGE